MERPIDRWSNWANERSFRRRPTDQVLAALELGLESSGLHLMED